VVARSTVASSRPAASCRGMKPGTLFVAGVSVGGVSQVGVDCCGSICGRARADSDTDLNRFLGLLSRAGSVGR
jgi:hypothetical protein